MGKQILIAVICHKTGKTEYYPLTISNLQIVFRKYLPDYHIIPRRRLLKINQQIITGFRAAQDQIDRLLH